MKLRASRLLLCIAVAVFVTGGVVMFARFINRPPSEDTLVKRFYTHRAAYERLREMLQADKQVRRVATWGVETTSSVVPRIPPEGDFPLDRYKEYLEQLKQAGGQLAIRRGAEQADTEIGVWASGWAGDTRHMSICWLGQQPGNQVNSLDEYHRDPNRRSRNGVFKHIDGNWYMWADW